MNDNYFLPVYLGSTILLVVIVFFIIFYVVIHSRRQHANRLEKEQLRHEYERRMFTARLEEQERAMTQISKEIHDNVSQKVDFIEMNLKAVEDAENKEMQAKFWQNTQGLLEQVRADLRNISYSLNSDYIRERGLGEMLSKELDYLCASRRIHCALHVDGIYKTLPAEKELIIYRIAQEALHNAAKYSKANSIEITLQYGETFTMKVTDDGVGFDRDSEDFINGLGFRNMQQRADLLGAELVVKAAPDKGCSVVLCEKLPSNAISGGLTTQH